MNSCSVKCKIFTLVPEWFWHNLNYFSFCWTFWKLICQLCWNFHKLFFKSCYLCWNFYKI
jgi:hypothetical protein